MHIYSYIFISITILLLLGGIFLYFLNYKIQKFEKKLINTFMSRTDLFPGLYEITKDTVVRHEEIFTQALNLRKREFSIAWTSTNIQSFLDLESHIHHEINFIFQVCNKNPKLLKSKKFLYIRDVMIESSLVISEEMKKYKKITQIYNEIIRYKNYTLVWYLIPFTKKTVL